MDKRVGERTSDGHVPGDGHAGTCGRAMENRKRTGKEGTEGGQKEMAETMHGQGNRGRMEGTSVG